MAQAAIEWTRGELSVASRQFLMDLPLTHEESGTLYVRCGRQRSRRLAICRELDGRSAQPQCDGRPRHVLRPHASTRALYSLVCRHDHILYADSRRRDSIAARPEMACGAGRRSASRATATRAAAYALFDTENQTLTYCRVAYDASGAAARIRSKGLPSWLGDRLLLGR